MINLREYKQRNERAYIEFEQGNRLMNNLFTRYFEKKRRRYLTRLVNNSTGKKVLDVGCGTGEILNKIVTKKRYGVDISKAALTDSRKEDNIIKYGWAEKIPFKDDFFDVVICSEILEHVIDVDTVLNEIKRVLTKKGVLVISVPNEALIKKFKQFLKSICIYNLILGTKVKMEYEVHLRILTEKSLRHFLAKNNFRIRRLFYSPFYFLGTHIICKAQIEK